MKICWDNLEKIKFTKEGNYRIKGDVYIEKESCKYCGNPFLSLKYRNQEYCSKTCGKMGKPRDEETKLKVSKTRKKTGISKGKNNPMYGRKFTEEHRLNMSKALKGKYAGKRAYWYEKKFSKYTRDKISESRRGLLVGKDNPNWKGGKSFEDYCPMWTDKEYKQFIRDRDGNKCLNPYCNKINPFDLHIHHINYDKKECRPVNLITVCRSCNARANFDRKWHKAWYKAIIKNRYGGV